MYFGRIEGNPITYLLRFLAFGEGDTAPVTREVLRQAEHDPLRPAPRARRVTDCKLRNANREVQLLIAGVLGCRHAHPEPVEG